MYWLQNSFHNCNIPGYNFVHSLRLNKVGGSVHIYVTKELEFSICDDLSLTGEKCAELLFIEIQRADETNIKIGTIYRPPDQNVQDFVGSEDQLITKISRENKNCYLMGDFNLNLLSHNSHATTGEFLDVMFSRSFVPLIRRLTRLTSHTATPIDNIFTNNINDIAKSGSFGTITDGSRTVK